MEFDVDVATTIVCDTQKQVERFVEQFDGNFKKALDAINTGQEGVPPCGMATVAYIPGEEVSKLKGPCGEFRVVEVLVLGVLTEDGFQFRDDPVSYFALFPLDVVTISLNGVQEYVPAYSHSH
jgi:hypothetical protein